MKEDSNKQEEDNLSKDKEKDKRAAELVVANKELAYQNEEKKKRAAELVVANKELAYQNVEKEKRSAELVVANKELAYQNKEKDKRAAELIIANKELAFQNEEKDKRAAELVLANRELVFQTGEKADRAAELVIADKELAFQTEEKADRAAELIIANKELRFQNEEKGKRAAELLIANKELIFQSEEKDKRAVELVLANKELVFETGEKADRAAELVIAHKELAFQTEEKADRAAELLIANKELRFQNEEKEKRAAELDIANKELVKSNKRTEGLNDQLEKKVKKRTIQLESMNKELVNQIALRKLALEKIEQLAYHDYLTGLPNRVLLVDRMQQAINLAKRIESPIGILFLDLDGFKTINDTHGHFQGDELLKAVAVKLTNLVRVSDTVARIGGDEFVIMLQNLKSADYILKVTNKIMDAFRQPFELNHIETFVTISIGISVFPADGETYETLIKNADSAMFKAKQNGKNQSALCTTIMKDSIAENMKLSNDLYRSLERNEFEVYYQPQINLNTKKIVGLEALLRWNHPELGLVSQGKFIHLAEQTKLINPIGKWVLHTVCMQNKAWQKAGFSPIRIAVNLSIVQLQNPEIASQIKEILDETKLLPQYLELEITERIAMLNTDSIVHVLNAFQEMGIYISIDDFGTEYSSLKYLKLLPINRIKIPVPFIQGINGDERDGAITKTIIVLARNMGLDVIAEGVETQEQESFLAQRMCDEMQGFYYYKPLPAKDIEALLQKN